MSSSAPTVLCVDDEPNILRSLKRLLRREECQLVLAGGGEEACHALEACEPALILSDYRMPGMGGLEFLSLAKEAHPHAIRVVLSGYAEVSLVLRAINQGLIYRYFTKPWDDEQLKADIRQCLETYATRAENRALNERVRAQNGELQRLNQTLEGLVAERTHSLSLSQEVIHKLPCGVFGVSAEGTIVLANQAAAKRWPELGCAVGFECEEVFEGALPSALRVALSSGAPSQVDYRGARLSLEPIVEQEVLGCVVIFGEDTHGN